MKQTKKTRRADTGVYVPQMPRKRTPPVPAAEHREESRPTKHASKTCRGVPKKRKTPVKRFLLRVLIVLTVAAMGATMFIFKDYRRAERFSGKAVSVSDKAPSGLRHIAIFGVDDMEDPRGRSDSTMVLTIDKKHRQIKLTSFQRDSYLPIEGHGQDKLNHSFSYGGAALTLKTLNQNFGLNVTDYVVLAYRDVMKIVDIVGGVDLEISEGERREINRITKEMEPDAPRIEEKGLVHLNGLQATAYARIRKIDSETQRTKRQRTLIGLLFAALKEKSVLEYPGLAQKLIGIPECSLTKTEVLKLGVDLISCDTEIRQYVVPSDEDNAVGGSYNGYWCWRYDIEAATERYHEFLKSDIKSNKEE